MKMIKLTALFILVQLNQLFAQNIELKEQKLNKEGKLNFSKPANLLKSNIANEKALLRTILQEDNLLQVELLRSVKDEKNTHNYYRFLLKSIPVVGADYVVHSTDGNIDFANGNIPKIPTTIKVTPALTAANAKAMLNTQLLAENKIGKATSAEYAVGHLVWFYKESTLILAYKIETKVTRLSVYGNFYIDANTGKQLGFESFICTEHDNTMPPPNATGTAQTLYSGTQSFTTDANFNGGFRLREIRNGISILTLSANHIADETQAVNSATDFFDNDNNWQSAEHGADVAAHDVHWATEKVVDYWKTVQNRNSIDNNFMQVRSLVHFSSNWNNAQWAGGSFNSMFYGDGGSLFSAVTSLDVCAHELGHGICQFTSNLFYGGESGALNEGFSDIWGATIEA